jgi:hypothetical protein
VRSLWLGQAGRSTARRRLVHILEENLLHTGQTSIIGEAIDGLVGQRPALIRLEARSALPSQRWLSLQCERATRLLRGSQEGRLAVRRLGLVTELALSSILSQPTGTIE